MLGAFCTLPQMLTPSLKGRQNDPMSHRRELRGSEPRSRSHKRDTAGRRLAPVTSRAVPSSMFILASSVFKPFQCLNSTLTQGGKGGHLFRLTCSIVLLGGRDTANKYHWHAWRVVAVCGSHWVCHSPRQRVLPGSTLLMLQGAL